MYLFTTRVCTVLKKWLEVHFYDFVEDMELTNTLLAFADNHLSKTDEIKKMKVSIKTSIKKKVFPTGKK